MDKILYTINHLSVQDICAIIIAITSIIPLIPLHKKVNHDAYIIIHPQNIMSLSDRLGCLFRSVLYIIFVFSCLFILFSLLEENPAIISSIFSSATPTPTVSPFIDGAKSTIQLFYDDINKKDYQSAYYLTKDGFGQKLSAFANGFLYTKHDTISFNKIKELPNYIIQITVTVHATENCPTGERFNSYYMMYTIVPDHGGFTILSGQPIKPSTYPPYCS